MTTKILIVDDHAEVRAELRTVLKLSDTIAVVGEAPDGREALRQAEKLRPDIVLMDLKMPGSDGFEATRKIKAQHLAQTVIIFTLYSSKANRLKAIEAGADAFLIKGMDLLTLLDTLESFSHQET